MKGSSLSQKLIVAIHKSATHEMELNLFSLSIPELTRVQWLSMVTSWESDPTKPNPYNIATECKVFGVVFVLLLMCMWSQNSGQCASRVDSNGDICSFQPHVRDTKCNIIPWSSIWYWEFPVCSFPTAPLVVWPDYSSVMQIYSSKKGCSIGRVLNCDSTCSCARESTHPPQPYLQFL